MRKIVTAQKEDGRSHLISNEPMQNGPSGLVGISIRHLAAIDHLPQGLPYKSDLACPPNPIPGPEGIRVLVATLRPGEEVGQVEDSYTPDGTAGRDPHINKLGYHKTETIDVIFVVEGHVGLLLDTTEVEAHQGDCIVQYGSNHAWRNKSTTDAKLMIVIMGASYQMQ